ncbi:hypothetical protein [Chryseobacterium indoltheticum]|uniref:hypothetical protein n=1 Tax=Chryseobacterium indoltheticum TaxID=254 RepID=UPI003F494B6F
MIKKVFLKKLNFIFEDDNLSILLKVCLGQLDNFSNTEITENDFISLVHYLFHNRIEILITNGNAVSLLKNLLQRFNLGERLRFLPCYKSHEVIIFKEVDSSFRLHDEVVRLVGKNEIFIKDWNLLFENKNILYGDLYLFPNRPFLEYQVRLDPIDASELKTYYYNEWKKKYII